MLSISPGAVHSFLLPKSIREVSQDIYTFDFLSCENYIALSINIQKIVSCTCSNYTKDCARLTNRQFFKPLKHPKMALD